MHRDPDEAHPAERKAPLRIGVLLDAGPIPRWTAELLTELRCAPACAVVLIVQVTPLPPDPEVAWKRQWSRVVAGGRTLSYRMYRALDQRLFAGVTNPLERVDGTAAMHGVAMHVVSAVSDAEGRGLEESDVDALLHADLDVLLNLGSTTLTGQAASVARHGVWSYEFGAAGDTSACPAGYGEVLQGLPSTAVGIRVVGARGGTSEFTVSHIRTQRFSVSRNSFHLHRKARLLLRLKLQELLDVGPRAAGRSSEPAVDVRPSEPVVRAVPGNLSTMQAAARVAAWSLRRAASRADLPGGWFLAYSLHDRDRSHPALPAHPQHFIALRPPPDRFWADPFNVVVDGRHYLFFEEYTSATGLGRIAMMALGDDGRWSPPVTVIERDYHLSYPFVFEWQGSLYMVPETLGAGRVEMYRAVEFPLRWEYHATLIDGIQAVDPTLVERDGRWWMFLGAVENANAHPADLCEQLHVFHAPTPLGPWQPHRRNPVKWDVRSSRPAGRLFWRDGELFRPAQACAERYGHAIRIHRVLRLDTDEYQEAEVAAIEPTWAPGLIGTHTINSVPGLTVIDGRLSHRAARVAWREQRRAAAQFTATARAGALPVGT